MNFSYHQTYFSPAEMVKVNYDRYQFGGDNVKRAIEKAIDGTSVLGKCRKVEYKP